MMGVNFTGGQCQGFPYYVIETNLAGVITLGHTSMNSNQNLNYVKYVATLPIALNKDKNYFSVDFGNHNLNDLGTGLSNGASLPC